VYDEAGNLKSAENNWAKVRRGYAPNGLLTHDALITRRYATEAPDDTPCGGGDKHAMGEGPSGLDWVAHVYPLKFDYDLAGRRTKLYLPTQLDNCAGICEFLYGYRDTPGTLDTLTHKNAAGHQRLWLLQVDGIQPNLPHRDGPWRRDGTPPLFQVCALTRFFSQEYCLGVEGAGRRSPR
jgi:hypothetical protein